MPANDSAAVLADFEAGRIDPARFPHREHVRVSYELLERHSFPEALLHLARGLRRLAAKAGRPEVYHETITAAFLALIAERRLNGRVFELGRFRGPQSGPDGERLARKILRTGFAAIVRGAADIRLAADCLPAPRALTKCRRFALRSARVAIAAPK